MASKPKIDSTLFGSITIDGLSYSHDVVVGLDGQVDRRRKRLAKAVYGTSHVISLQEAEHVYQEGARRLIVGTGQAGLAKLSSEAASFLRAKACHVDLLPTPEAARAWNESNQGTIGLFHVTC